MSPIPDQPPISQQLPGTYTSWQQVLDHASAHPQWKSADPYITFHDRRPVAPARPI